MILYLPLSITCTHRTIIRGQWRKDDDLSSKSEEQVLWTIQCSFSSLGRVEKHVSRLGSSCHHLNTRAYLPDPVIQVNRQIFNENHDVYLSGTKGRMSGLQTTAVSMLMLLLSTIMELIMIVMRKKIIVIPATFFIIINTRMESFIKEI